ncbi:hypothetical protein HT594_00018 [Phenacoccus solenopsis nudivirus]|nr:hypothetical protein HT594_00018 [Phenacoccus solenopsis nudivirus]
MEDKVTTKQMSTDIAVSDEKLEIVLTDPDLASPPQLTVSVGDVELYSFVVFLILSCLCVGAVYVFNAKLQHRRRKKNHVPYYIRARNGDITRNCSNASSYMSKRKLPKIPNEKQTSSLLSSIFSSIRKRWSKNLSTDRRDSSTTTNNTTNTHTTSFSNPTTTLSIENENFVDDLTSVLSDHFYEVPLKRCKTYDSINELNDCSDKDETINDTVDVVSIPSLETPSPIISPGFVSPTTTTTTTTATPLSITIHENALAYTNANFNYCNAINLNDNRCSDVSSSSSKPIRKLTSIKRTLLRCFVSSQIPQSYNSNNDNNDNNQQAISFIAEKIDDRTDANNNDHNNISNIEIPNPLFGPNETIVLEVHDSDFDEDDENDNEYGSKPTIN